MKFLHTADIHLGIKLSSDIPEEKRKILQDNNFRILKRIVDFANSEKVDALIIAGDLFDSKNPPYEVSDFAFKTLNTANCPVFISCGNHDPLLSKGVYDKELPKNINIFGKDITKFSYPDFDIYGSSFTATHKTEEPFTDFTADNKDKINIMVLHGEIAKKSFYNPINLEKISKGNINYLALGHIHKSEGIKIYNNMYYGYSGSPQPYSFKETEDPFIILCEIKDKMPHFQKVSVNYHNFIERDIDITNKETNEEIIDYIMEDLKDYNPKNTLFKLKLKGKVKENSDIDINIIKDNLENTVFNIDIIKDYGILYNIDLLKKEESVRGEFVRNALIYLEGKDEEYIRKVIEYGVNNL